MSDAKTYSVFISYSHVDKAVADEICSILDQSNRTYFRDIKNIDWGDDIGDEVRSALLGSQSVLVILSQASDGSAWVPFEVGYCSALGRKVLPFLTHPSQKIPPYISGTKGLKSLNEVSEYFQRSAIESQSMPDLVTTQKKPNIKVNYGAAVSRASSGLTTIVSISVENHDEQPIYMNNVGLLSRDNMKMQLTNDPITGVPYYRQTLNPGQRLDYRITRDAFESAGPFAPNGIDPTSIVQIVATDDIGRQYFADPSRIAAVLSQLFVDKKS